jgi:hypothetical protein
MKKERLMTSTMSGNGIQRKSLAGQIDRLDAILDGLADALNESVAEAVREVVGQVVHEAVSSTVREVLSSPELLRAALTRHPTAMPTPEPTAKRRTLKDLLEGVRAACDRARQATVRMGTKLGRALAWGLRRLRHGGAAAAARCAGALRCLGGVGRQPWRFRRSCTVALTVGVLSGVGSYLAGPLIASVASGLGGAALTLAGMILMPLWRLMTGGSTPGA